MGFDNLKKSALTGLASLVFLGGCKAFNLNKKPRETYYPESLVFNTVIYEVSTNAEGYLKAIEDLYLHENKEFEGMTKLPDSAKVAIRVEADKMGVRDRRITEEEAKIFYDKVVNEYERTLSLQRFESKFEGTINNFPSP